MDIVSAAGGPGRRPRALPNGPIKDLVTALDDLILIAHGDGRTSGSRQRLVDYVNICEPERRMSPGALSRQMGDVSRKPWGPEWRFVTLLVTYCVPAPLHRARRSALARNQSTGAAGDEGFSAEEVDRLRAAALEKLAGLWCAAWKRQRPPDGYTGGIIWPDGSIDPALEDPDLTDDVLAKVTLLERNYAVAQAELEAARRQVRHATADRQRVRAELDRTTDAVELESTARQAAESRNRKLAEELADLSDELGRAEHRAAELEKTVARLTDRVGAATSLLTDEVAARRTAEKEAERLRDTSDDLRSALRSQQLQTDDLNTMLGSRQRAAPQRTDFTGDRPFMLPVDPLNMNSHHCDELARALDAEALWRLVEKGDRAAAQRLPHVLERLEDVNGLWELFKRGNERAAASLAFVLMLKGDLVGLAAALDMGNKYAGLRLTQARMAQA